MAEKIVETPKKVGGANGSNGVAVEATPGAVRHPSTAEVEWEKQTLAQTLAKSPERDYDFTTISSYPIRRLYTEADLPADWNPDEALNFPGQPPYTRGIHSTMYRGKLWTMRQ